MRKLTDLMEISKSKKQANDVLDMVSNNTAKFQEKKPCAEVTIYDPNHFFAEKKNAMQERRRQLRAVLTNLGSAWADACGGVPVGSRGESCGSSNNYGSVDLRNHVPYHQMHPPEPLPD